MDMFETLQPFVIAFLIGLVIGIERERSQRIALQAVGVRTFIILALLGVLAAWVQELPIKFGITFFVLGAILLGYMRSTERGRKRSHVGLTTELAAAMVFILGFITPKNPLLSAVLGVLLLLILLSRKRLHYFSRDQIKPQEIKAATAILLFALVILPILPNHPIDAWQIFNPRLFGLLVMLIALIQFGGYVAIRALGEQVGMILMGFFGGLVSSTAVFLTLPKLTREQPNLIYHAAAAGILATVGMLIEFCIIISVAAPPVMKVLLWPVVAMMGVGIIVTALLARNHAHENVISKPINPLDLKAVLKLTLLIGGMMIFVSIIRHYIDHYGMHIIAFFVGLFEVHGISLATAALQVSKKISLDEARSTIAIVLAASFVSKFIILVVLGRNRFAILTAVFLLLMVCAGSVVFWLA